MHAPSPPESPSPQELGRRIAALRRDVLDVDQAVMADRLEVPTTTLARWEQGQTRLKAEDLLRIAILLDVSMDYLMRPPGADRVYLVDSEQVRALRADRELRRSFRGRIALPMDSSARIIRTRADLARLEGELES
jgi:transcriptional regulator with XRE-family HTH domain